MFAKAFISSGRFQCEDEKLIAEKFNIHLRTIKKKYDDDSDDKDYDLQVAQANRLRSVSTVGLDRAMQTDDWMPFYQLARQRYTAAKAHPDLIPQVPILQALGYSAMSDDEPEHEDGQRRFRIVEPEWRSARLTTWLRMFDGIYSSTKFNDANRPSRGNWTRIRIPPLAGAPKSKKNPPPHLPRNFFRPGYLESLLDHELETLDVQDEDYSLSHTDEVIG